MKMTDTEKAIYDELKHHVKIHDVQFKKNLCFICEVDRIQSVARGIVKRITSPHGNFNITSTTKNVKNIGFTRVIIEEIK